LWHRDDTMKVAMPTLGENGLEDQIFPHFGRAPAFTIVDTDTLEFEIQENVSEHFGGGSKAPSVVAGAGAEALLCSGIGPRAITMFESLGIRVFTGASGSVAASVKAFKEGRLHEATDKDACIQHRR
jgi:predicted Fe-Mo cluster-binding NifX family protein